MRKAFIALKDKTKCVCSKDKGVTSSIVNNKQSLLVTPVALNNIKIIKVNSLTGTLMFLNTYIHTYFYSKATFSQENKIKQQTNYSLALNTSSKH